MNNVLYMVVGLALLVTIFFLIKFINKSDFKTFLHDGLSLDESKISLMMISFSIFIGIAVWSVFALGDIPDNVLYLILGLGSGIVGMNISNSTISRKDMYNEISTTTQNWLNNVDVSNNGFDGK